MEPVTEHRDPTAVTIVETLALLETQLAQPSRPPLAILPHTSHLLMEPVEPLAQLELASLDPSQLDLFFQDQEQTPAALAEPPMEPESAQPLQAIPMELHQATLARLAHHMEPAEPVAPATGKHKDRDTEQVASVEYLQSLQAATESQANPAYQANPAFQVNRQCQDQLVFRDPVQQVPRALQVIALTTRTTTRSEDDRI